MAEKLSREETYVNAIHYSTKDWAVVQAVVTIGRTLGYIPEMEYSRMMTYVTGRSANVIRSDGAETIELARNKSLPDIPYFYGKVDPETILPREP